MARQPASSFWCNERVKQAFLILCERSFAPKPDWSKFRNIDKKGIFGKYSNAQLSMKFRKLWLLKNGLCYYCGVNPFTSDNGLCNDCIDKIKNFPSNIAKRNLDAIRK